MSIFVKTNIQLAHTFDAARSRHLVEGMTSVLHCHHYATLYCQLADDTKLLDGKQLLADSAEDAFFDVLRGYYQSHAVTRLADRVTIAEQYFAAVGLGRLVVLDLGETVANVELRHSHVDDGWIKKWGQSPRPINFIARGYVAALTSAALDRGPRSFLVTEVASIAMGAERSRFNAVAR